MIPCAQDWFDVWLLAHGIFNGIEVYASLRSGDELVHDGRGHHKGCEGLVMDN